MNYDIQRVMKDIEFTQFLFPNRTPKKVLIDVPYRTAEKYWNLRSAGFVFEIENKNEVIWMSCVKHSTSDCVDWVGPNGPGVPGAVLKLIDDAASRFLPQSKI